MPQQPVAVVMDRYVDRLMAIAGVDGVGLGKCDGEPCIKVFVHRRTPTIVDSIPAELDGYNVVVEETGGFEAFAT